MTGWSSKNRAMLQQVVKTRLLVEQLGEAMTGTRKAVAKELQRRFWWNITGVAAWITLSIVAYIYAIKWGPVFIDSVQWMTPSQRFSMIVSAAAVWCCAISACLVRAFGLMDRALRCSAGFDIGCNDDKVG